MGGCSTEQKRARARFRAKDRYGGRKRRSPPIVQITFLVPGRCLLPGVPFATFRAGFLRGVRRSAPRDVRPSPSTFESRVALARIARCGRKVASFLVCIFPPRPGLWLASFPFRACVRVREAEIPFPLPHVEFGLSVSAPVE